MCVSLRHTVGSELNEVVIEVGQKAENDAVSYTFGPFRLDTRSGELRRGDARVLLTPKVFQLLLTLAANPGKLMAKRELLDMVWADTNVEEGSVTRAITRLRSALNDNAARPQYIETVPRRGYRFVALVEKVQQFDRIAPSLRVEVVENGRRHALREGDNVIGRATDCEVSIELASVSRHHAIIALNSGQMTVRDLGSKNGTFVCGRRVEGTVPIASGERMRTGSVTLEISSSSPDSLTATSGPGTTRKKKP
jgi:DNA-binding winged helix-turn-helix (wHTH) protein